MAIITSTSVYLQPLGYSDLTTEQKAYIDALITVAEEQLTMYCNRVFPQATYTELADGNNNTVLYVKNPPINSLTSIVLWSGEDYEETISSTYLRYKSTIGEIVLSPDNGVFSCFPAGYSNVTINYSGGYSSVPASVQKVLADMVMEAYDPGLISDNATEERLGQYQIRYSATRMQKIMLSHKSMLAKYKLWRVN